MVHGKSVFYFFPRFFSGCEDTLYSSALVVRKNFPEQDKGSSSLECLRGKRMAINSWGSCSGHLLPAAAMGAELYATTEEIRSGGHLNSCVMVAEGKAGK